MRNGTTAMPQQQQQQQLNNDAIQQTKQMMSNLRMSANPQTYLLNMINQNPQLVSLIKSGGNLEALAKSMAKSKGVDINQLIAQLGGT